MIELPLIRWWKKQPGQQEIDSEKLHYHAKDKAVEVDYNTQVYCSFCLHRDRAGAFTIRDKDSKYYKCKLCPECGTIMLTTTLYAAMSIEQFAEWVAVYVVANKGHKRFKWPLLKERLKANGWANKFWPVYYAAKEAMPAERY